MNRKQLLALLLTLSVSAAASILAAGNVSGPDPDPADLPTAGTDSAVRNDASATADGFAWEAAAPDNGPDTLSWETVTPDSDADTVSWETVAPDGDSAPISAAPNRDSAAAARESVETYARADSAGQYDTVTGQWTLAELAAMDAPPVTGDADADTALEAQWRAARQALENAAPATDPESVLSAVPDTAAQVTPSAADTNAGNADTKPAATNAGDADIKPAATNTGDAVTNTVKPDSADGPALTGDAKTDSRLEAEWKAAHPAPVEPETPGPVTDPADTPEASAIAGPDDGGGIRTERVLDRNEQRDAKKREQIVQSATEAAESLSEISFAEVESRTREDNLTVRAMRESVSGLENMDYEKSEEDLIKALNGLSMRMDMLGLASNEPLAQSFAVSSLQSQYESLYSTFEQLHDGTTRRNSQDAIEQMRNAMDQVVMGSETLYIALVAMEDQYAALARQLAALNRTVEELELRYSLGQISALTLNQAKSGRTALSSGMETLSMNIRTYKMRLENMLGASLTGEIKLGELPAVTAAQIAALDVERDFSAAQAKSYELYAAARTLQDAKETFLSSGERYRYNENNTSYKMAQHTWTAAQDTYNGTVRGYELKFRTLYEQVHDYYQVWNASKDALETQRQDYQAKELRHKQGNISQNALLEAKDSLSEKEEAVRTAANNLFSAYNNYCWAAQSGILN